MKKEYDFSNAKRGPVVKAGAEKQRITIRLDAEVVEYFKHSVEASGGGNYQTAINAALKEYITGQHLIEVVRDAVHQSVEKELRHAA